MRPHQNFTKEKKIQRMLPVLFFRYFDGYYVVFIYINAIHSLISSKRRENTYHCKYMV